MLFDKVSENNSLNLLVGMKVKIKQFKSDGNGGRFILHGKHPITKDQELIRGFGVTYSNVGTITEYKEDEISVVYEHKQPKENVIWFFALTGEYGILRVSSVPVHDHSSIVQGGPAYGTYFSGYKEGES